MAGFGFRELSADSAGMKCNPTAEILQVAFIIAVYAILRAQCLVDLDIYYF